jgi:cytidylate kinase
MRPNGLIVAIDGPAGAGKSTVARELSKRLGYFYVDTGAMYRVVGLLAQERGLAPDDGVKLGEIAATVDIRFDARPDGTQSVFADGRDVTEAIRAQEIGEWASKVSTQAEVRERLVDAQRKIARAGGAVLEGRDIGTVVFPDADVKFFLDASAEERGRRRQRQLEERGLRADLEGIVAEIQARDSRDRSREHSPLRAAEDAESVDTTQASADQVVDRMALRCRAIAAGQQKP